jgi:hypothetical protein
VNPAPGDSFAAYPLGLSSGDAISEIVAAFASNGLSRNKIAPGISSPRRKINSLAAWREQNQQLNNSGRNGLRKMTSHHIDLDCVIPKPRVFTGGARDLACCKRGGE